MRRKWNPVELRAGSRRGDAASSPKAAIFPLGGGPHSATPFSSPNASGPPGRPSGKVAFGHDAAPNRGAGLPLAYDDWANREALASLAGVTDPPRPELAVALLAHIVAARNLWLERMRPMGVAVPVWPGTPLSELDEALAAVRGRWRTFLADLTVARLGETILYVNSKGEPWESRVADILMHVVIHGGYHRGQIAALVRGHGAQPAYTDYIHCVRSGHLPESSSIAE